MKTKVEDLRKHLFWALEGLKDGTLSIDSAKAMADIGTVIVNSAKVEVAFMNVTGAKLGSGFLPIEPRGPEPLKGGLNPPRVTRD